VEKFTVHPKAGSSGWGDVPDVTFNFGKYKGSRFSQVIQRDNKYLEWVLTNVDGIPDKVREIARVLLQADAQERYDCEAFYEEP
jgi:hypothetical protein